MAAVRDSTVEQEVAARGRQAGDAWRKQTKKSPGLQTHPHRIHVPTALYGIFHRARHVATPPAFRCKHRSCADPNLIFVGRPSFAIENFVFACTATFFVGATRVALARPRKSDAYMS
jgi:hypothetical protein